MSATVIPGTDLAAQLRAEVKRRVQTFAQESGRPPGLATVLVGDDPASEVYVRNKRKAAVAAGMLEVHERLPSTASEDDIAGVLERLAADDAVSGILLQLPLPSHLNSQRLIDLIPPEKDVDGLTTVSAGLLARGLPGLRPCTPSGILRLIDWTGRQIDGASAVVVGRSQLVGGPMASLLTARNATVTVAHSRTPDFSAVTRTADILVVAAGVPGLIGPEHVLPGAVVIDVGIHRHGTGLTGDVRFDDVAPIAGWLTPVPGGVGPMTIASLLANTVDAAEIPARAPGRSA